MMNTYTIYLGATPIASVANTDAAYACYEAAKNIGEFIDCYEAAKNIGEFIDRSVSLVWDETGEEVAYSDPSGEYSDDEPADIDDDCGFDPYLGCFTDDC